MKNYANHVWVRQDNCKRKHVPVELLIMNNYLSRKWKNKLKMFFSSLSFCHYLFLSHPWLITHVLLFNVHIPGCINTNLMKQNNNNPNRNGQIIGCRGNQRRTMGLRCCVSLLRKCGCPTLSSSISKHYLSSVVYMLLFFSLGLKEHLVFTFLYKFMFIAKYIAIFFPSPDSKLQ